MVLGLYVSCSRGSLTYNIEYGYSITATSKAIDPAQDRAHISMSVPEPAQQRTFGSKGPES